MVKTSSSGTSGVPRHCPAPIAVECFLFRQVVCAARLSSSSLLLDLGGCATGRIFQAGPGSSCILQNFSSFCLPLSVFYVPYAQLCLVASLQLSKLALAPLAMSVSLRTCVGFAAFLSMNVFALES